MREFFELLYTIDNKPVFVGSKVSIPRTGLQYAHKNHLCIPHVFLTKLFDPVFRALTEVSVVCDVNPSRALTEIFLALSMERAGLEECEPVAGNAYSLADI